METRLDEIADGIYRISTFIPEVAPPAGFTFNVPDRRVSCLTAAATSLRALADLKPRTLALMHGSSFQGDGASALNALADGLEARFSPEADFTARASVLAGGHP